MFHFWWMTFSLLLGCPEFVLGQQWLTWVLVVLGALGSACGDISRAVRARGNPGVRGSQAQSTGWQMPSGTCPQDLHPLLTAGTAFPISSTLSLNSPCASETHGPLCFTEFTLLNATVVSNRAPSLLFQHEETQV